MVRSFAYNLTTIQRKFIQGRPIEFLPPLLHSYTLEWIKILLSHPVWL